MLPQETKRALKKKAFLLKPVILMGQKGITDALLKELDLALEHHELLKVKMTGVVREERKQGAAELAEKTQSHVIQMIGQVLTLYRRRKEG